MLPIQTAKLEIGKQKQNINKERNLDVDDERDPSQPSGVTESLFWEGAKGGPDLHPWGPRGRHRNEKSIGGGGGEGGNGGP